MINNKKRNVIVIGKGKWGIKVINILRKKANIIKIINSKTSYKKIYTKKIDWIFILTDNSSHYKLSKFFLKKKLNVFCEKPLSLDFLKGKELVKIANKNKVKLYVSDVEKYKYKKFNIRKLNNITRFKFDRYKKEILERLCYHDLYLLSEKIDLYKIKKIKIQKNNVGNFSFSFSYNNKIFNFVYSLNRKNRIHRINGVNYLKFKGNPLSKMIDCILYKKISFKRNNEKAVKAVYFIKKLKRIN